MADYASSAAMDVRQKKPVPWLEYSAKTWFVVTAIGQWLFVAYILGYFGLLFLKGGAASFAETHLPNGYIPGDTVGNAAIVIHIIVAGFIIGAGQLQLIPAIRNRVPRLHRWSGRFYMSASVIVSLAGLYLVWTRERVIGHVIMDIGTSMGGILVLIFAPLAFYYARKRDFAPHRRWALRLFMVVSAVWFLRLMIFGWYLLTGGVGIDGQSFTGPFLYFAAYAQSLLPLLVLELYFLAQSAKGKAYRGAVAGLVFLLTGFMVAGIFAVSMGVWIPRIGI